MARRKGAGWGGSRKGSGRPALLTKPISRTLQLEEEDWLELRDLAKKRGTSAADLVRRAVRSYLNRSRRKS